MVPPGDYTWLSNGTGRVTKAGCEYGQMVRSSTRSPAGNSVVCQLLRFLISSCGPILSGLFLLLKRMRVIEGISF